VTGTNVPVIVQQPQSQTVATNDIATFTVAATGASPLSYQWFYNGSPISGATSTSYSSVQYIGDNGATFTVVVSNPDGSTTSAPAVLTVVAQQAPSAPQNLHVVSTQ
jgi:phospholipase/lecithinase/hemolysin